MEISECEIGTEFTCGDKRWRCTDIGTRVIVAICISDRDDDLSWYDGPPYAVVEYTFDETDLPVCEIVHA